MEQHIRVLTVRLESRGEQWEFLRLRASQAAAYRNKYAQAQLADALKWRVPNDAEKDKLTKHIRSRERGDLSSSIYSACEAEVKKDWARGSRKIMAGVALPQYKSMNALGFATITGRPGVEIVETDDGFSARLMVSANHVEGGCWITVPISRHTRKDMFRIPKLQEMADGKILIRMARVIFKLYAGKVLLQLTYAFSSNLPEMGKRHATFSELDNGRILLRSNAATMDYTSRINHLKELKAHWDGITRRWRSQIGKRRGHARLAREKNAQIGFEDRQNTYIHQWTREMVNWMVKQGVGTLAFGGFTGGDWAAHRFAEYLSYKCKEAGIEIVAPTLKDPTVDRTVKAVERKERRKAKKIGEAVRELKHHLTKDA